MSDTIANIEPTAIALDWTDKLITAITHAIENNQTSIELGGRFQVVYQMNRWQDALDQALHICEGAEEYELCSKITNLKKTVHVRTLTENI